VTVAAPLRERRQGARSADAHNAMHPIRWIPADAEALLDVGCNVGALLRHCAEVYPGMRLAGVDMNAAAVAQAHGTVPDADVRIAGADRLPYADASFDCVTCIEVLEHVPAERRRDALAEMRRVLRPGGRLVLRVPHDGLFAFLDVGNLRFRFPGLYRRLVTRGRSDDAYEAHGDPAGWHHHFALAELLALAGDGWTLDHVRRGGLFLLPLHAIVCWPWYRRGKTEHALFRALLRVAERDFGIDYGAASYGLLLILRRS
jgi:SAM-dependent methyltransferase